MENSISYWQHFLLQELEEKELSPKQQKIAGLAKPKNKIGPEDSKALRGGAEIEEGEDHEVSMAQNSLKSIVSAASQLMNKLGQDEKDIPAWIQDHISNAENYINQASKNYHEYANGNDQEDQSEEEIKSLYEMLRSNKNKNGHK